MTDLTGFSFNPADAILDWPRVAGFGKTPSRDEETVVPANLEVKSIHP